MICENELYRGGPVDDDLEPCLATAVTKCVDCGLRLCVGCVDTCYEKGCDICPGCVVDHERKTGHQVNLGTSGIQVTMDDESIDRLAAIVAAIIDKGAA